MSQPDITTFSSLLIDPSYNDLNLAANNGFFLPALTQAQIDAIAEPVLRVGGLVFNITTNNMQVYQDGVWTDVSTNEPGDFRAPLAPTVDAPNVEQGIIYYDTTTNRLVAGVGANAAYANVYTSSLAANGDLVIKTDAGDPANVQGVISFNTDSHSLRTYNNGAMGTVYISPGAANTNGNLIVQTVANTAALPANAANGMIVYQTDTRNLKTYNALVWTPLVTSNAFIVNRSIPELVNYQVLNTDVIIQVDTELSAVTVTLPAVADVKSGQIFIIKDEYGNASGFNITVTPTGVGVTIDDEATYVMNQDYEAVTLYFNGEDWSVIGQVNA